jgi:hypothetical protein
MEIRGHSHIENLTLEKKKNREHALPQESFGLSTPRSAGRVGATPGNTGRGRQRERLRTATHQASSKRAVTNRDSSISKRSTNRQDITGNNRAHSSAKRARTSGQEAGRIQEPRHAKATNSSRVKGVNVQCLAHPRSSDSVAGHKIQEIQPQIRRIRTARRRGFATEQEMLHAPPAAYNEGVPTSRGRRRSGDANLTSIAKTESMLRTRVPRHRVTERQFPREDTKEKVHNCSRYCKSDRGSRTEREQWKGSRCEGGPAPWRRPREDTLSVRASAVIQMTMPMPSAVRERDGKAHSPNPLFVLPFTLDECRNCRNCKRG